MNQFIGQMYIVLRLHEVDIFEQTLIIKQDVAVFISRVVLIEPKVFHFNLFATGHHIDFTLVYLIGEQSVVGLPCKHLDYAFYRIGLVLLYLKLQFHVLTIFWS